MTVQIENYIPPQEWMEAMATLCADLEAHIIDSTGIPRDLAQQVGAHTLNSFAWSLHKKEDKLEEPPRPN